MLNFKFIYDLFLPSEKLEGKEVIVKNCNDKLDAENKFKFFLKKKYPQFTKYKLKSLKPEFSKFILVKDYKIQSLSKLFWIKDYFVRKPKGYHIKKYKVKGDNYTIDEIKKLIKNPYIEIYDIIPLDFKEKELFFVGYKDKDDFKYKCVGYHLNKSELYKNPDIICVLSEDEYRWSKRFFVKFHLEKTNGEKLESKRMILARSKDDSLKLFNEYIRKEFDITSLNIKDVYSEYDLLISKVKYI